MLAAHHFHCYFTATQQYFFNCILLSLLKSHFLRLHGGVTFYSIMVICSCYQNQWLHLALSCRWAFWVLWVLQNFSTQVACTLAYIFVLFMYCCYLHRVKCIKSLYIQSVSSLHIITELFHFAMLASYKKLPLHANTSCIIFCLEWWLLGIIATAHVQWRMHFD